MIQKTHTKSFYNFSSLKSKPKIECYYIKQSYTVFLTTSFFNTSLSLIKSTGADTNLSISNSST